MDTHQHTFAMNPSPGKGEVHVLFAGSEQTLPQHHIGPQILDHHLVHYIVKGKGEFHCMGQTYSLTQGDQFVIFPNELFSYMSDPDEPWCYRWIGFRGNSVDQLLSQLGVCAQHPTLRIAHHSRILTLYHLIEKTLSHAQPTCDLQSGAYLRLLFSMYRTHQHGHTTSLQQENPMKQQVERAIQWMKWQHSKPITIEQMASELGYHRTYLSKIFKKYAGVSPIQYLMKLRLDKAKSLLVEKLTIEQIAFSVGYADALYFSKQFKKHFGTSPSEYRITKINSVYNCKS